MTLATVLADAEMEREKAGVLRRREEALEFASLLYWPILIAPWREGRHLVFDGMAVWSFVFTFGRIPDARSFRSAVEAAKDHKSLRGLLNERAGYFDQFAGSERLPVLGLFIHEELMRDILAHVALAKPRELRGTPVLTPRITAAQVQEAVGRMKALAAAARDDLEVLVGVDEALRHAMESARQELEGVRRKTVERYGKRIDAIRPDVLAQVSALEKAREEKWSAMQPRLLDLQGQVHKAEADLSYWDQQARMKDNPNVAQAKEQRAAAREQWDEAKRKSQEYQGELARVREGYDRQVQAQWERIRVLERERDGEIEKLIQEEQAIVGLVGRLSTGIGGLRRQLDDSARFLEEQGVPTGTPGIMIVRMPVFVAGFASDRGRRFKVYPPMVAKVGKGVLGSLKSTFGGAILPLEAKTQHFEEVFRGGIEKAAREDASLAAYLTSVGNSNNLLHLANLQGMLRNGLGQLKTQGWIKDKHERELIHSLERHIAQAAKTAPKSE